jgi:hypothetical protein
MAFNIMDMFGGDINKVLKATEMAMRSTDLGRGGVVKAELDPSGTKVEFVISATGQRFKNPSEAFVEASTMKITQYERIVPSLGGVGDTYNNPRRAQMGAILQSMQDRFNQLKSSGDTQFLDFLSRAGITEDDLSFGLISSQSARGSDVSDFLQRADRRLGGFIPFIDDEGADLLQLMVGGKSIKQSDMHKLMSFLGNDIFNPNKLAKIFGSGGTSEDIENYLAKIGKRVRGLYSDRDINILGTDIVDFFSYKNKFGANLSVIESMARAELAAGTIDEAEYAKRVGSMHDNFGVIIEEGLDVLKSNFGLKSRGKDLGTGRTHISILMNNVDTKSIIESGIRSSGYSGTYDDFIAELESAGMRDVIDAAQSNKELLEQAKSRLNKDQMSVFEKIMGAAEKEWDGTGVLNNRLIHGARSKLEAKIESLKTSISSGTGDTTEARISLMQLEQQKRILDNASNLYQITGRGSVGGEGIKTAFEVLDLDKLFGADFANVAYIIGRSGLKNDINFGSGTNMISLSGLGSPRELVYTDPVTVAFHPEVFASQDELDAMQDYSATIMRDFEEAVNDNTLPKNVRRMLEEVSTEDYSSLPIAMQRSKIRNQEFARQILQLHQSGIGPRESPQMMNALHSFMASQMYTVRNKYNSMGELVSNIHLPVSPNTYRFAIGSEASSVGLAPILDTYVGGAHSAGRKGFQNITFNIEGSAHTADLLKFRVNNHKMLFAAGAIEEFYDALGGFDLDDKGLPKLMTASYRDSAGMLRNNLIFSITRQPSGSQEIIYGSAALTDTETLRNFFGKSDFIDTLERIGTGDDVMEDLLKVLKGKEGKLDPSRTEQEITDAILEVYNARGRTIAEANKRTLAFISEFGSSPLRYTDEPSRDGIYRVRKADLGDEPTLRQAIHEGLIDEEQRRATFIREELQRSLPDFQGDMDPETYRKILAAATDEQLRLAIDDAVARGGGEMGYGLESALSQSIMNTMRTISTQERDILGVYINRSMIVGSTLNQMADFAEMLDAEDAAKLGSYTVGLGTQEFAIDRGVNFTLQKSFIADYTGQLAGATPGAALHGLRKVLKVTDVGQVGEEAILNMGRRFGAATAIYENALETGKYAGAIYEPLRPVIDSLILSGRLTESHDVPIFIQGMMEGITGTGYTTTRTSDILENLLKHTLGGEDAVTYLVENFGADGTHQYASLAKLDDFAKKTMAQADALKRLGMASMPQDQILAATPISEDAQRIASFLMDRHKEEMDSIFTAATRDLADQEKLMLSLRKINMGEKVVADMKIAAERFGITTEELINAMDLVSARRGERFRLADLDVLGDDGLDLLRQVQATRTRRINNFYSSLVDSSKMDILTRAADAMSDESAVDDIKASFADLISSGHSPEDAMTMMGDVDSTVIRALDDEASDEAKIIRNINAQKELDSDIVDQITARTARTVTAPAVDDTLGLGLEAAVAGEDYSSFVDDVPFNRDFVGSLKNLFENNKLFKNSVYAAGALIVGSFAYSAYKDRTAEDIQGPPLLPGGSAYEENYPDRLPEIPQVGTVNYNPGVSYKVNLYGDRNNVNNFRSQAMELGNFNMNTTMYDRIPDVGRDPYADIASSY